MAELIESLQIETLAANLQRIRIEIAEAALRIGRDPAEVEILAATKYVPIDELPKLATAGITHVGENRAQDLQAKVAAHGALFAWDFIGALQSRKVRLILPHVRLIHSVASESAMSELDRHRELARADLGILLEVNLASEQGKSGIEPAQIETFIERAPFKVRGLMTMPPLATQAGESRRWFAALRELADAHELEQLSMGTSQDYVAAVEEGATIVRLGRSLYAAPAAIQDTDG